MTLTQLLVVPRSIPMILLIICFLSYFIFFFFSQSELSEPSEFVCSFLLVLFVLIELSHPSYNNIRAKTEKVIG